jgi:hypothetical protein
MNAAIYKGHYLTNPDGMLRRSSFSTVFFCSTFGRTK